jgi:flagellar basal-body rod modification protein FlgD
MTTSSILNSATNSASATANNAATSATSTAAASAISGTAANTSAASTTAAGQELNSNFSEFLQLLTTQLQNQDPLNPMDSSQFTQQLVEYSQVEQQIGTNSKLDSLTTLSQNQTLSLALGYVGKNITYASSDLNFDGTTPVNISVNLPSAAKTATANIYDSNNNLVDTVTLNPAEGTNTFTWNGATTDGPTAPSGDYSLQISALDSTGAAITATTAVTGSVSGVESQDSIPYLLVGDRSVALGNVIDTSAAGTSVTPTTTSTTT